jgi:hypothetical protein
VVVLQAPGAPAQDGFVAALRIQLAGTGEVVAGPELTGASVPARVEAATPAARAAGATLAVWLDRAPVAGGGEDVVLYVVGEADGRAVVQVFRIPAGSPADTDRALALKVSSVLDELLAPAARVVLLPSSPPVVPGPAPAASRARLVLGLESRLGTSPGDDGWEGRGVLLVGVRLAGDLELHGTFGLGSGGTWENASGKVRTSEYDLALGARVLGLAGPIDLGVRAGIGLRFLDATGTTPAGVTGDDVTLLGVGTLAVEKRWPLGRFELAAFVGLEWTPREQIFTVNEQPVAELGHVRGFVGLSIAGLGP